MEKLLRCGVVGAGVFGGYHAHQYARIEGASLAAVFDLSPERAEALAGPLGARAFSDLHRFLEAVDAVSVTTPATTHADLAMAALLAGKAVYVEKPLAVSVDHAQALVQRAKAVNRPLAVGHQERMVFKAMGLFDVPETPIRLDAIRRGTVGARNLDVSCVLDLMIHDIDLALALSGSKPVRVTAETRVLHGPYVDEATAEVVFEDGLLARFEASRIAEARERRMRIVYPSGEVEIDFLTRVFRNTTPFPLNPDFAETPIGKDPLGAALAAFVAAARGEAGHLPAEAEQGARALDLALQVERAGLG